MRDRTALAIALPIAKETLRRRKHPFFSYRPDDHKLRPQLAFHRSRQINRIVFGGNQSGKSRAVAQEIAWWLTESHPFQPTPVAPKIFVLSAKYMTIQEGVWRHLRQILPEWEIEKVGPSIPQWEIPTYARMRRGGQIVFVSGSAQEEARRTVQAAAIHLAVIDEEIDEGIWKELVMRRLAYGGRVIVAATLVRSEPWCVELEERHEDGDPTVGLWRFDTERALECGHVKAEIVDEIKRNFSHEEQEIRLHGKSQRKEGIIYAEFGAPNVCKPFEIPKNWTRYMAIDPGWRTCAVLWAAVAPDGKYVIYREFYYKGARWTDIAAAIYQAEGRVWDHVNGEWRTTSESETISVRWIDPSGFGMHEGGQMKIGNLLGQKPWKLVLVPAQNDLIAGIEACRRSLAPGLDGIPRMRIFNNCQGFLKEVRKYRWQRNNTDAGRPEARDVPVKRDDHSMDCWRYLELGGLRFRHELVQQNPFEIPVSVSAPLEEIRRDHWQRVIDRQRRGEVYADPVMGTEF